ncbi:uncharacterized protein LOC125678475 isoform X3 [Ostrea edulis]|uniref:uncharacterized protein LOC125678475 isoform X3 n=1 Tax=Ostrea edulis TaxID=37623 RepID=UPI0024AF3CF1|nr:uncharacterized protein LOC125678475 isoform X3 [Ostrea edulis]
MGLFSSKSSTPSVVNAPTSKPAPLHHAPSSLNLTPNQAAPSSTGNQTSRQWVDVYVNGVPPDFDLSRIPSSKLRDAAGPAMEAECKKRFPKGLKVGVIADTGGYNAKCQRVYHVTLTKSHSDGSQNQTVCTSVKNCLERANQNSFSSIAFPDLGSALSYPPRILADLMFTAMEEFSKGKTNPNLSRVVFSIFKKQVYKEFIHKARDLSIKNSVVTKKTQCRLGRIEVCLKVGKLIEQQVDVIVCSGPQDLQLKNGGMAEALLKAAGAGIQTECHKKYPQGINYGEIAITDGYDLPCKFVYHGAIPKWASTCTPTPKQSLKEFVTNCLEEANKHKMTKTLAMPTLGTGSLEYPPDEVAEVMAKCIEDFDKKHPQTELTRITIVAYNLDKKWQTVQKAFLSTLQVTNPSLISQGPVSSVVTQKTECELGRIEVCLKVGELIEQQVDVIVCSGPQDLQLKNGGMAEALLKAAGAGIQTECHKKYPQGINYGEIAITDGYDLPCKFVYHGTIPKWASTCTPTPKQSLKEFVTNCLEEANKHKMTKTLAMPTLGTGSLEYPPDEVAEVMAECIEDFDKKHPQTELTRITIVAYNLDKKWQTVQNVAFLSTLQVTNPTLISQGPASSVVTQKTEFKLGRIEVCLKVGKLIEQQVDVIVCSGPQDLQLKNGGMAEALLKAAGAGIQTECHKKYPQGINYGEIAITDGYDLPCKFVYHGAIPKWASTCTPTPKQSLKEFVTNCLEEANKHKMTKTLAMPTLGTGSLEYPPDEVAEVMAECIEDFDKKHPQTELTRITIVAYNLDKKWQTVQKAFLSALKMTNPTLISQGLTSSASSLSSKKVNSKQYFQDLYASTPISPSYWTKYTSNKTLAIWNTSFSQSAFHVVDVKIANPVIYKAIEDLALRTWQPLFVGKGVDSVGLDQLGYTKIKITKIERLENPHLFEEYWKYREKIFLKAAQSGVLKPLGQIPAVKKGDVLTTATADASLQVEIYPGINEHYLFHGTQPELIQNIHTQGMDGRVANSPSFGRGVYCAESSTKSDQYADPKTHRDLKKKKMLLVRACLGEMFIRTDTVNKYAYTRPPCQSCHQDRCIDATHSSRFFDSIVVDGNWNFREFILYDNKACYPEYLITYKRI